MHFLKLSLSDEHNKMVLTDKQKAVIENDFNEKGWNAYKSWKKHPSFECSRTTVHNLIKKNQGHWVDRAL